MPQEQYSEFCVECGEFVLTLNDETGWCNECSGLVTPSCPTCGKPTGYEKQCGSCSYKAWLERNANSLEEVMAINEISVRAAKEIVSANNRPICLSCKNPIKGGQKGQHFFCSKNPECVKAQNVYSYHIHSKSQSEALQLATTASVILRLTREISQ